MDDDDLYDFSESSMKKLDSVLHPIGGSHDNDVTKDSSHTGTHGYLGNRKTDIGVSESRYNSYPDPASHTDNTPECYRSSTGTGIHSDDSYHSNVLNYSIGTRGNLGNKPLSGYNSDIGYTRVSGRRNTDGSEYSGDRAGVLGYSEGRGSEPGYSGGRGGDLGNNRGRGTDPGYTGGRGADLGDQGYTRPQHDVQAAPKKKKGMMKLAFEEKSKKESYKGKTSMVLGILHIILGVVIIALQASATTNLPVLFSGIYAGCWSGSLMIINGLLGIWAGKVKWKPAIVSFLICSLLCAAFAVVVIALSALQAGEINKYVPYYPQMSKIYTMYLGLTICGVIEFLVCVISAAIGFVPICCQPNQVMAMTQVDVTAGGGQFRRFHGYENNEIPVPQPGAYTRALENYSRGSAPDGVNLEPGYHSYRRPSTIAE